jgi:ethanolamine utilization protein EutQ (cupin superfamily)
MSAIKLFKAADREFKQVPVATGALNVARIVEDPLSHDLGAGVVEFEDISIPWTLNYNEVFYVLEGELRFRTDEGVTVGKPGDLIFIPEGTTFRYEAIGKAKHEEERAVFEQSLKQVRKPEA